MRNLNGMQMPFVRGNPPTDLWILKQVYDYMIIKQHKPNFLLIMCVEDFLYGPILTAYHSGSHGQFICDLRLIMGS